MSHSRKHAYLVMAHNKFDQLKCLLSLLDDPRNDIYLHIDKKTKEKFTGFEPKHSKLFMVDPIRVTWSGHSQIACEMRLFAAAAPGHYMYYHLLSGLDLPIKTQDEIHGFFQKNDGKNFMEIDDHAMQTGYFLDRTQYYHFFQNMAGRDRHLWAKCLRRLNRYAINIQKALGYKRKEIIPLYKGANWVSITDELLQYILGQGRLIRKQFYYSFCADEVFLQSLAMHSPYRDTIVNNSCREIDWIRGEPYTFRKEDFPMLLDSPAFFARKFDEAIDNHLILAMANHLKERAREQ